MDNPPAGSSLQVVNGFLAMLGGPPALFYGGLGSVGAVLRTYFDDEMGTPRSRRYRILSGMVGGLGGLTGTGVALEYLHLPVGWAAFTALAIGWSIMGYLKMANEGRVPLPGPLAKLMEGNKP